MGKRLSKLGGLLVKTLAKPLSKRIKQDFSRFEVGRTILINVGQLSHNITSRMTIWSAGYTVRSIKPLENDKALKTGAELVGESFVLLITAGVLVWEYQRGKEQSSIKEEKERMKQNIERMEMQQRLQALERRLDNLDATMQVVVGQLAQQPRNSRMATTSAPSSSKSNRPWWLWK